MHHRLNDEQFSTTRLRNREQIVDGGGRGKKIRLSYRLADPGNVAARSRQATKSQMLESLYRPCDFEIPMRLTGAFGTSREG